MRTLGDRAARGRRVVVDRDGQIELFFGVLEVALFGVVFGQRDHVVERDLRFAHVFCHARRFPTVFA